MKKILVIIMAMLSLVLVSEAKTKGSAIDNVLEEFGVDRDSISVSIKTEDGKSIYSLNEKMLMNPASVQKVLTTPVSVETLGKDYEFKTELYKKEDGVYLIKLGADPYLSFKDLKTLVANIDKTEPKKMFIDDSIVDNKTWGEGWQWDDDMNVLMPRFGAYNLDRNLIKITVMPTKAGQFATVINPSRYPLVFYNNVVTGDKTAVNAVRDNAISANTLVLTGTVNKPRTIYIPSNNLKRYFNVQLSRALEEKSIYFKELMLAGKLQETDSLENTVSHSIEHAIKDTLKNSDNRVSETMFKLAGGKYLNQATGSDVAGIKMFNDYCVKNGLDNSRIRIADASGVSKNNLVSAKFITEFLLLNKDNEVLQALPTPGEGTLTHRMLPLKNNLKAKTGTLADVSTIAGYLTSKNGKKYVFCIMTNDMKMSASDKKMLEDFIIREMYFKL